MKSSPFKTNFLSVPALVMALLLCCALRMSAQNINAQNDLFPVLQTACNYYLDVTANDQLDSVSNIQLNIISGAANGSALINGNYISYCSFFDVPGIDQFQYSVSAAGRSDTATVYINILPPNSKVNPGDADQNGVVEHFDVLSIGLAFGVQGPSRDSLSNALAWAPLSYINTDPGATDCNNDGITQNNDLAVIETNFQTSFPVSKPYTVDTSICDIDGIPLFIQSLSGDSIADGDSLAIAIHLGESALPREVYGIAFTLEFDNGFVGGNQVQFSTGNSWMLQNDSLLFFKKDFQQSGEMQVALSRTSHIPAFGGGEIMRAILPIDDNIDGVPVAPGWHDLKLHLVRARLISEYNIVRDVCIEQPHVKVNKLTTAAKQPDVRVVKIYPNPSTGVFAIEGENILEVSVADLAGKEVFKTSVNEQHKLLIDLGKVAAGSYLSTVKTSSTVFVQKIVVQQ